jgi:hypothetical protein
MANVKFRYFSFPLDGRIVTQCKVVCGSLTHVGAADCSPKDNFSRIKGRKIALTRAIKDLPRSDRKVIWNEYLDKCKV